MLNKTPSTDTETPPTQSKKKFKWEFGKTYVCLKSASPGYQVGEKYKCYLNEFGFKCLKGRDGHEDICSMLVSSFREVS